MNKNFQIIVVDFDETLFRKGKGGVIGECNESLVKSLIAEREKGNKVILNTTRWGHRLKDAVAACKEKGLIFDAVNDNLPEVIAELGTNPRKIWGDKFIDNKAVKPKWPKK